LQRELKKESRQGKDEVKEEGIQNSHSVSGNYQISIPLGWNPC
jgi:hypothetical protein